MWSSNQRPDWMSRASARLRTDGSEGFPRQYAVCAKIIRLHHEEGRIETSLTPWPNTGATGPPTGSPKAYARAGMYRLVQRVSANTAAWVGVRIALIWPSTRACSSLCREALDAVDVEVTVA